MRMILTAEDDKEINRLICEYLSSQGYEMLSALNGLDAVRIVRENTDLSLLILDLMLPFQSDTGVLRHTCYRGIGKKRDKLKDRPDTHGSR